MPAHQVGLDRAGCNVINTAQHTHTSAWEYRRAGGADQRAAAASNDNRYGRKTRAGITIEDQHEYLASLVSADPVLGAQQTQAVVAALLV